MKKIPTVFARNHDTDHRIRNEVVPGCEWVLAGEGVATQKLDGTCCLIRGGKLYKRHDAKKGKAPPPDFEASMEADPTTGRQTGWVPVGDGPEDKWHREAWFAYHNHAHVTHGLDFNGTYELIGPKVAGNPEGYPAHTLLKHEAAEKYPDCPRDYDSLRAWLADKDVEGVVWHHPDGRMAKVKKRGFGLKRKPQ